MKSRSWNKKEWGEAKANRLFTYTSNVDGHFQYAGYDSGHLVECHGNIHHYQCSAPCNEHIWQDSTEDLDIDLEKFEAQLFNCVARA